MLPPDPWNSMTAARTASSPNAPDKSARSFSAGEDIARRWVRRSSKSSRSARQQQRRVYPSYPLCCRNTPRGVAANSTGPVIPVGPACVGFDKLKTPAKSNEYRTVRFCLFSIVFLVFSCMCRVPSCNLNLKILCNL